MRYIAIVFCCLCLIPTISPAQVDIAGIISQTNVDTLSQTVKELTGVVPVTLSSGSVTITSRGTAAGRNNAAQHIANKFRSYGLSPIIQPYTVNSTLGRNVYAVQRGTGVPKGQYIICAHYDAISTGADDDASGVAVVLESARLLSKYQLNYSVVFVLFDQEEEGFWGSYIYVDSVSTKKDSILGAIDVDMCGWDSNSDGRMEIHATSASTALANLMSQLNTTYAIGLSPVIYNPSSASSDWLEFGVYDYKAICYTESYEGGDFNPHYHSSSDQFQYFNVPYFVKEAKLGIAALATLAGVLSPEVPVQLASFGARVLPSGDGVQLTWTTVSEINNYGFYVQRGSSRESIADVAFVPGNGTTLQVHTYTWIDRNLSGGYYRLRQVDLDGTPHFTDILEAGIPAAFRLEQNYPNPFNPTTTIHYQIPMDDYTSIRVYDFLGREVATLVNGRQLVGSHEVSFNAANLASGAYVYRIVSGAFHDAKTMVVLK